jgi:hypothetical protein
MVSSVLYLAQTRHLLLYLRGEGSANAIPSTEQTRNGTGAPTQSGPHLEQFHHHRELACPETTPS